MGSNTWFGYSLLIAAAQLPGCVEPLEMERERPKRGSVGQELYGLMCDRVGAQSLREDVMGASFAGLCHPDSAGNYAAELDESRLPPLSADARDVAGNRVSLPRQQQRRNYGVARVEALASERDELIEALDALLPDVPLATPLSDCAEAPGSTQSSHDALQQTLAGAVELYNDGTVPALTRAAGDLLERLRDDAAVQRALVTLDARAGYRPDELALGLLRPALAYPRLYELGDALLSTVAQQSDPYAPAGPRRGVAHEAWNKWLEGVQALLREPPGATTTPLASRRDGVLDRQLLSRPRSGEELLWGALTGPGFDLLDTPAADLLIVRRDYRGVAKLRKVNGALPAPFMANPDGEPMLDEYGALMTKDGTAPPRPFGPAGGDGVMRDTFGRALTSDGTPVYQTVDLGGSLAHAAFEDLVPLVAPQVDGGAAALERLLAALPPLLGPRQTMTADGVQFVGFDAAQAPLLDLVHAVGASVAQPEVQQLAHLATSLARERPDVLPRTVGLIRRALELAEQYPGVQLSPTSTFWDEIIELVAEMSRVPGLLEAVLTAMTDPQTQDLQRALVGFLSYRDLFSYQRGEDPTLLNGAPYNLTTASVQDPRTPVDRSLPDTGDNRSLAQRFLQLLHDTNGLPACTKEGAVAHVKLVWPPGRLGVPIELDYPTSPLVGAVCGFLGSRAPDRLPECGILRFDDIAALLVDVLLARYEVTIQDDCLKRLAESPLTALVGGTDAFLEDISGIDGFSTRPTPEGVARLAFFDTPYDSWGGYAGDEYYPQTRDFLADLMDPVGTMVCPSETYVDPNDGTTLEMRRCERFEDTLRGRDPGGMFPLETLGFLDSIKPLAAAFADRDASPLLVKLLDTMHLHWGSADQTPVECDPSLPRTDGRWCSQDGLVAYEPLFVEVLRETELLSELSELAQALKDHTVQQCTGRQADGTCVATQTRDGVQVLAEALRAMLDPVRHRDLANRQGVRTALRNDGTTLPQTTPLHLTLESLRAMDAALSAEPTREAGFEAAVSAGADVFLAVDGEGKEARFVSPLVQRGLPAWLELLTEQVAAHCPNPQSERCTWAFDELTRTARDTLHTPVVATGLDLFEVVRTDTRARDELMRMAAYLLETTSPHGAHAATLAALLDTLQLGGAAETLEPLYRLVVDALAPTAPGRTTAGAVPAAIEVLARFVAPGYDEQGQRRCTSQLDPRRAVGLILERLVTPAASGPAPWTTFMDAARSVNRQRPGSDGPLQREDMANIAEEFAALLLDDSSGLEQVYAVVRQATEGQ